jgi:hypothetical protein
MAPGVCGTYDRSGQALLTAVLRMPAVTHYHGQYDQCCWQKCSLGCTAVVEAESCYCPALATWTALWAIPTVRGHQPCLRALSHGKWWSSCDQFDCAGPPLSLYVTRNGHQQHTAWCVSAGVAARCGSRVAKCVLRSRSCPRPHVWVVRTNASCQLRPQCATCL